MKRGIDEVFSSNDPSAPKRAKNVGEEFADSASYIPNIVDGVLVNPLSIQAGIWKMNDLKIPKAYDEDKKGLLRIRAVSNDGQEDSLRRILEMKHVISNQLTKMNQDYIWRLIMEESHQSIIAYKVSEEDPTKEVIVGCMVFREFQDREFAELVFATGYGTYLMNKMKRHLRNRGMFYVLTYGDNSALGFFRRNGFTQDVTLDRKVWGGCIKDYEGATLIQCSIPRDKDPEDFYFECRKTARTQRTAVLAKLQTLSTSHIIRKGIPEFKQNGTYRVAMDHLPALLETGWDASAYMIMTSPEIHAKITDINKKFLLEFKNDPHSRPFYDPVTEDIAPGYFAMIPDPIDISTMEARLERGNYYLTQEMLVADLQRMMENCKKYNGKGNGYWDAAVSLEKKYLNNWKPKPVY